MSKNGGNTPAQPGGVTTQAFELMRLRRLQSEKRLKKNYAGEVTNSEDHHSVFPGEVLYTLDSLRRSSAIGPSVSTVTQNIFDGADTIKLGESLGNLRVVGVAWLPNQNNDPRKGLSGAAMVSGGVAGKLSVANTGNKTIPAGAEVVARVRKPDDGPDPFSVRNGMRDRQTLVVEAFDLDEKSAKKIAKEAADLADKAEAGTIPRVDPEKMPYSNAMIELGKALKALKELNGAADPDLVTKAAGEVIKCTQHLYMMRRRNVFGTATKGAKPGEYLDVVLHI